MGVMGFLRNRMGLILVIVIGFALFAFIAGEVIHYGSSFLHGDANVIGEIGGDQILYNDFNTQVDQNTQNFEQQSHQTDITPQITSYIQETTWNTIIRDKIFTQEMDKLGIVVGTDEEHSLIQGDNPSPQIVQAFGDPKTGQLDRDKLNNFLSNITTSKADTAMSKALGYFCRADCRR